MKRITTVASAMIMLIGFGIAVAEDAPPPAKAAEKSAVKKQTTCPITGEQLLDKKVYVDADGKRVYFCCKDCIDKFNKDPAKYISKLEKDGVTLDKTPAADPAKKGSTATEPTPAEGHEHSGKEHPGHEHPGH